MYIAGALLFLIGLVLGSFLNVVVFRTNTGRSVVKGRSRCMTCDVVIRPADLVPIVSYFLLRGRCRTCKNPIGLQYPLVEFVTGLLFAMFFFRYVYGFSVPDNISDETWMVYLVRDLIFVGILIVLFLYDLKYITILDRFTIPAMIVAILINLWIGIPPLSLLIGGFAIAGFFAIQFVVSGGTWVGGGDIRMGALMGFMLGLEQGLVALFFSYLIGAFCGSILLLIKQAKLRSQVPMGTFLAIGTLIMLFAGDAIVDWYLMFFV